MNTFTFKLKVDDYPEKVLVTFAEMRYESRKASTVLINLVKKSYSNCFLQRKF